MWKLTRRSQRPWKPSRPSRRLPSRPSSFWVEVGPGRQLLLNWQPWWGIWASAVHPTCNLAGERACVFPRPEKSVKKKQGIVAPAGGVQHLAAVESNLFAKLHPLVGHMAITRYDDGDPRIPGWITVKTQGSSWVTQVKDPDSCMSFQAVAVSLDDSLSLAALLLEADSTPWEADRWLMDAKKRTRK